MNFFEWLKTQIDRNDPIGIFVRDEEQMETIGYAYREWRYHWAMGTRVPECTVDWWSDAEDLDNEKNEKGEE